jgi:hypothetical protein
MFERLELGSQVARVPEITVTAQLETLAVVGWRLGLFGPAPDIESGNLAVGCEDAIFRVRVRATFKRNAAIEGED